MSMQKLEADIGKKTAPKKRTVVYLALALLLVGAGFLSVGLGLLGKNGEISADTSVANPPMPSAIVSTTPVTPTDPGSDADNPPTPSDPVGQLDENRWAFPSGWSLISGEFLQGGDMTAFSATGLILYSFNDPAYPNRTWSTFPWGETTRTDLANVKGYSPFGYYVYNPADGVKTIDFSSRTTADKSNLIIARGWHLMYWPNEVATKDELFSKITLKYQDGTKMSATDAVSSKYHRTSIKVYGIANESVIDPTSAIKEITGTSSDTTLSSVSPRSYFWLYIRRTKDRVVDISISE